VFRAEQAIRLPEEIRGHRPHPATGTSARLLWIAPIAAILAIIVVLVLTGRWPYAGSLPAGAPGIAEAPASSTSTVVPSPTATEGELLPPLILPSPSAAPLRLPLSPSATTTADRAVKPSSTPEPTATLRPTATKPPTVTASPIGQCGHQLEQPFGSPHRLVLHQVQAGESLNMFADRYNTTVDATVGINFELNVPIRNESVIVIAPGLKDASVLPPFEAEQVTPPALTLSALAAEMTVPQQSLAEYNDFGSECQTILGWVAVPRQGTGTP